MNLADDNVKIEVLRYKNQGCSLREIEAFTSIPRSTVGKFLRKETYREWWDSMEKPIASGELHDHHTNIKRLDGNRFILTSAQNSTYVHQKFLQSLEVMAEHIGAQIIVGTYSYNTNGFQNLQKSEGDWFDPLIKDYIRDEPLILADGLMWCGELNILPTAVNPLSGFHSYTKSDSGIIPHAKVQMESLPVHKGSNPRFLYTTGSVTQRNYIQKKAGQKASFHHIFGALLVEVDDEGDWFVRQLIADTDTGEFYDLDVLYTPTGFTTGHRVEAINYGDIHSEKVDPDVANASWGYGNLYCESMLDYLKPKYQFVHDGLDFSSRNHHNIDDIYFRFQSYIKQNDTVEADIKKFCDVLEDMERPETQTVVVQSNHDLALTRWLKTADYRKDPANALFFLKLQYAVYESLAYDAEPINILEYACNDVADGPLLNTVFLRTDDSFMICGDDGIECGMHGDLGQNGSRGSINSFQRIGTRANIGHSHSAGIKDGVYQAGVSASLDMGYNKGPTTWSNSHVVTYKNSKRAIVTIKQGKWKA